MLLAYEYNFGVWYMVYVCLNNIAYTRWLENEAKYQGDFEHVEHFGEYKVANL